MLGWVMQFIKISGGLDGGAEPPAFQRAARERLARASADKNAADSLPEPIKGVSSYISIFCSLLCHFCMFFLFVLKLFYCAFSVFM